MKSGAVIIYKEQNMSSQGAVSRLKRLLDEKKAGHTGTLDPLATGVLPILVGRGVKASEYMITEDKHYRTTLLLGVTTDTEDVTGEVLTECDNIPSEDEVRAAVAKMVGEIRQVPPMYSAIKVGGRKLYDLAREGVTIEREARVITVYSIGCEKISDKEYFLDVHCSKGTYIRTLCADIGKLLGCGGTMKTLERTECAGFTLADAHTLSEIEEMSAEEREALIIPTESLFPDVEELTLSPFFARLARCGVEIYLKKIDLSAEVGKRFKLFDDEGFFALGEVREFDEGLAVKPIKQFDI